MTQISGTHRFATIRLSAWDTMMRRHSRAQDVRLAKGRLAS
jgi:hypothetical protein